MGILTTSTSPFFFLDKKKLDWHAKGNVLLAGSADASTYMWNGKTGGMMGVFVGHSDRVIAGKFSPDGKKVVTASADRTAK